MFEAVPAIRRPSTATSAFGVSRRENHDASGFYARFTPPEVTADDDVWTGDRAVDDIFVGDARSMPEVPDRSVAIVVTSPPYFAGKEYEEALGEGHVPATYFDYLQMLEDVFAECVRKLEPGGRIAVNVANLGRKPYRSLSADVTAILQDKLRLLLRGEILWQKAEGSTGSCAWGSFQRPANPVLRDLTERIVVASKGRFDRAHSARERARRGLPCDSSMRREDFLDLTTDVWRFPAESATRVGHPAPFPVELPDRLIHLYTYLGDLVLDPFMGSGTTAVAAVRAQRRFAGYDTDPEYVKAARRRVEDDAAVSGDLFVFPATPPPAGEEDPLARAMREGRSAREVAEHVIAGCGFRDLQANVRLLQGIEVSFRGVDGSGEPWLFDVAGGFTTSRPGLRRTDLLWKAIAKASVLHERPAPREPLVLLTAGLPGPGSAGDVALQAVTGHGRPIAAVVNMLSTDGQAVIRALGHR